MLLVLFSLASPFEDDNDCWFSPNLGVISCSGLSPLEVVEPFWDYCVYLLYTFQVKSVRYVCFVGGRSIYHLCYLPAGGNFPCYCVSFWYLCFTLVHNYWGWTWKESFAEHSHFLFERSCFLGVCEKGRGSFTFAGQGVYHRRESILAVDICKKLVLVLPLRIFDNPKEVSFCLCVGLPSFWNAVPFAFSQFDV